MPPNILVGNDLLKDQHCGHEVEQRENSHTPDGFFVARNDRHSNHR
jgi:hypothetical protein